jgi:hypothetical protein
MNISALSQGELAHRLKREGIAVRIGPYTIKVRTSVPFVVEGLHRLYADYPLEENAGFSDYHVTLAPPTGLRRWIRPKVDFFFDCYRPFKLLPMQQAFPFFEWGVNWCIAGNSNQYLIIHAATLEKDGRSVILPGAPGSGKSTLCAALACRGWRLLTDELTLIPLHSTAVVPVPRPVGLKNESIEVIRNFEPGAVIGRSTHDTSKGTVAHMQAPLDSILRSNECATPAWIIFPKYRAGAKLRLTPESKGKAFMQMAKHAFNYNVLGEAGFKSLANVIDVCDSYSFSYANLDEAIEIFDGLELPTSSMDV